MTVGFPKYHKGDQITLYEGGRRALYSVTGRLAGAYALMPQLAGKERILTDAENEEFRLDGNLEHYPQAPMGLTKEQYELLQHDYDGHKPEYRQVALIKWEYLSAVDRYRRDKRTTLEEACERAAVEVHAAELANWEEGFLKIEREREARRKGKAHFPEDIRDAKRGDKLKLARGYLRPFRPPTIQEWWRLWVKVGRSRNILIPLWHDRGNRTPRLVGKNGVDLYREMRLCLKEEYYTKECPLLTNVYEAFKEKLAETGNGEMVSYNALNDLRIREFGPYEELSEREGNKYARQRLDVARRVNYDMTAMQEIEIDHCLLDIILVHETSGRVLNRPWLTMAMCRSTRMIVGAHLSFEPPSEASLQRCLMHALWPKDLRGLGLENEWPCQGIPEVVVCDNGKDFHGETLKGSQMALGFDIRFLPGRMPWLKGIIERCFGRLQIQVLDLTAGKAFIKIRKNAEYDPAKHATMSLPELRRTLLRWIVDDYHVTEHQGIEMTPLERWELKQDPSGFKAVARPDDLLAIMGSSHEVVIGKKGVNAYNQYYWHDDLTSLRRKFGEDFKYAARSDPYDIGSLLLIVPREPRHVAGESNDSGKRLTLWSTTPERAVGVTAYQHRVRKLLGKRLTRKGKPVTEDTLHEAKELADAEVHGIVWDTRSKSTVASAARYEQDNGRLLTPVAGWSGSNRPDEPIDPAEPSNSREAERPSADTAAIDVAIAPDMPLTTTTKTRRAKVVAPTIDAADALVLEDDFEARFNQMEIMD